MFVCCRMKYNIWFVFLHDGTNAVRIADRSDQNFQIQAVAVFSAKLLLDFVGIVLIHVKDDQFLWMRCCNLSAELASDGASASCHQQGFSLNRGIDFIHVYLHLSTSKQVCDLDIAKSADADFAVYQLVNARYSL